MSPKQSLKQEEVPLAGKLAEFRTALQEEFEAARRSESSLAIPLINGRRISQIGGSYQYAFEVENLLNLPGDAPGDLYVQDYPTQEVYVVSIDGMTIILSVQQDLGRVVPSARLQSNLAHLMRKLIERVEALANISNPVGDRILGDLPISGTSASVDAKNLNASQQSALASSLGRNVTFIWGPPGTGKTHTIGAIGENLYRRQRSMLLVSHTNAAVDEAVQKIVDAIGLAELSSGKILRVGDVVPGRSLSDEKYREVMLKTHTDRRSAELAARRDACEADKSAAVGKVIQLSRLIDVTEWVEEVAQDITGMSRELGEILELETALEKARVEQKSLLLQNAGWASAAEAGRHAKCRLDSIARLDVEISDGIDAITIAEADLNAAQSKLEEAENMLAETTSVSWLTRRWRGLPHPERQREEVTQRREERDFVQSKHASMTQRLATLKEKLSMFVSEVDAFRRKYSASPEQVLTKAAEHTRRVEKIQSKIVSLLHESAGRRKSLEGVLVRRLAVLRHWGLSNTEASDIEGMLDAVQQAHEMAKLEVTGQDLSYLTSQRDDLNALILGLDTELQRIEESLKRVEELVIADAVVIATTLTRAYLRDSIQSRRFDTIILDEASMAPIPAIWVAASTATDNAVVVGDFRQLPPIVISENELPRKWLGRDVFVVAGIDGIEDPTGRRVDLLEQKRMHPQISIISNTLVYNRKLLDAQGMDCQGETELAAWYKSEWGHDHPVLLVDTGSVGAWVTSVSRGSRASRLNFLSATICVDLAGRLLRKDREELPDGNRRRILIACPYRPHAQLLKLLIREEGLSRDVLPGTVHSFQGSEADVVILDLVNDEPHWRVAMFMPDHDIAVRRLLNVALTRARRRLIVVGDFEYIQRQAKRAFVGRDLVPFLLSQYPQVDARDVVPVGLAARAARAQSNLTGGSVEPNAERLIVTQDQFYPVLQNDLAKAHQRIVIYSAFVTQDRLGQLAPQIRAAVERGVRVYVVTKAWTDRSHGEMANYQRLEKTLADWGVTVIHKRRMHEKLVLIDNEITWVGSLNPLSFSNTQEIMERRCSKDVSRDYTRTLLLNDLLMAYEYGQPMCPICGNEVVASEGADDPFYWTCIEEDCYSRSVDQPPLRGGVIVCANCGGSVEFGEWGGKPVWRCKDNPRHHQRIARTHLRLPKMRELVPRKHLRRLERALLAKNLKIKKAGEKIRQSSLFDLSE
jgi:hypothetical protein